MLNQGVDKLVQQEEKGRQKEIDNNANRPIIGITMGDPAGIGPEIIVAALSSSTVHKICRPFVLGDASVMEKAVRLKNSKLTVNQISADYDGNFSALKFFDNTINVLNLSDLQFDKLSAENFKDIVKPSKETGEAMIAYITRAVDLCVSSQISAMVTAPITKTALQMAGSEFHGHTELIARRCGAADYAMMLAGDRLKVVLVTIHIPLSKVSASLTVESIVKTIRVAGTSLKNNFGIKRPKIAVAALNPHAGESGMFGNEEESIICPAVKEAIEAELNNGSRFDIEGPFPPDTIFYHASQGKYDCVICMYHDQGLIPFKLLHFSDGVNTTLGLPIIRTSVDHGTAYDIAWQNRADHSSLVQAIKMAVLQACSLNNQS